jgi:hypothetical protein
MDNNTTTDEIELAFRNWWQESYKRPPNAQAVMTHVAFAKHVLQLVVLLEAVREY